MKPISPRTSQLIFALESLLLTLPYVLVISVFAIVSLLEIGSRNFLLPRFALCLLGYLGLLAGCVLSLRFLRGGVATLRNASMRWWVALLPGVVVTLFLVCNVIALVWGSYATPGEKLLAFFLSGAALLLPLSHLLLERFARRSDVAAMI